MRTCMIWGSYVHRFSQHKDDRQKKEIHGRIKWWSGCQRIQQAMSGCWGIHGKTNRLHDRNVQNTRHIYEIAGIVSWSLSLLNYNCEKQIARYTSANKNNRVVMANFQNRDTNTGQLTFPRDHCAIHEHNIKSRPTTPHPTSSAQIYRSLRLKIPHCWLHARNSKRRDLVRVDFHVVWKRSYRGGREPPARKCIRRE